MQPWVQWVLATCTVLVSLALVATLLALRRVGQRVDRVLAVVEQDLEPLVREAQGLLADMRALSQEAHHEVKRVGALTEQAAHIAEGTGRLLTALGGLTRAGQLIGVVAGLKAGVDVFVDRLRRAPRRLP